MIANTIITGDQCRLGHNNKRGAAMQLFPFCLSITHFFNHLPYRIDLDNDALRYRLVLLFFGKKFLCGLGVNVCLSGNCVSAGLKDRSLGARQYLIDCLCVQGRNQRLSQPGSRIQCHQFSCREDYHLKRGWIFFLQIVPLHYQLSAEMPDFLRQ